MVLDLTSGFLRKTIAEGLSRSSAAVDIKGIGVYQARRQSSMGVLSNVETSPADVALHDSNFIHEP